jgi:guanosine-3',5'-bis(diphosphate) 3'-pyrophosphohydrolase
MFVAGLGCVRGLLRPADGVSAGLLLAQGRTAEMAMGTTMSKGYAELLDAIAFSAAKHRNQRRKDAEASPYINHPLQLAHVLGTECDVNDLKTLMAAVLHDTVDDTETSYAELCERFGKKVADVVMEVTDDKSLPKAERKQRQVEHAPHMSKRAALVKLAEKTCNLRDVVGSPPAGWPLKRKQDYFDWALQVVDGLPPVNDKLRRAFDDIFAQRP